VDKLVILLDFMKEHADKTFVRQSQ